MAHLHIDGTALITGAASGIGEETAYALAEAGATAIAFADIDGDKAKQAANKSKDFAVAPGYRALVITVDVTDASSVQHMVESALREFGRIDYSINAAGVTNDVHQPIDEISIDEFDRQMSTNARGTMLCNRAVSKVMLAQTSRSVETRKGTRDIGRGSIVNLGSANSYAAVPGKVPYVASKHAVMGITKSAALDLARKGIRVNAVCPSWVRTPMVKNECKANPELEGAIKALSPLGRAAEVEELTGVILFLCSPNASYVTGTGLVVDAGLTLTLNMT